MEIKAKETKYNGRVYRSRLEARWAVVFDVLNLQFEYEPVRFESKPGEFGKIYSYLPDFYFPEFDLYGEVKPTKEKLFEEQDRISWAMDFNFTPMSSSNGLLLLGQIPFSNIKTYGYVVKGNYLYHSEGVCLGRFIFTPFGGSSRICTCHSCYDVSSWSDLPSAADITFGFYDDVFIDSESIVNYSKGIADYQTDLHHALSLGRSARFDFDDSIPKMLKEHRTIIGGKMETDTCSNKPNSKIDWDVI